MVARRNQSLAWLLGTALSWGLVMTGGAFAQDAKEAPPAEEPKTEAPQAEAPKTEEAKPAEAPKAEAAPADLTPPTVPPEVEAKLEAARRAVAEAIVAAEDAGLVDTSISPPPILDILVKGYAIDARVLKDKEGKKPYAVSPEVFAGWFTGYGKLDGINYVDDVRILNPSAGLKTFFDQRANMLNHHIEAVRKAKGEEAKPAEEPKAEEAKPAEEPKAEEAKAEEPKAEEAKAEEAKPAEEPKAEEAKAEEPKADEEPKAE